MQCAFPVLPESWLPRPPARTGRWLKAPRPHSARCSPPALDVKHGSSRPHPCHAVHVDGASASIQDTSIARAHARWWLDTDRRGRPPRPRTFIRWALELLLVAQGAEGVLLLPDDPVQDDPGQY